MPGISTSQERRGWVWFLAISLSFLLVRVPVTWREPGEMDEEYYAVPGLFVVRDGVPRLPHVPGRSVDSIFYQADTALFAEPPLSFYVQAVFFSVLPPTYGTARLASITAGIAVLGLIWSLTRQWFGSLSAAVWATGLFSLSRWFFLQAIRARPDVLCTAFGLAAVWALCRWRRSGRHRWLGLAGIFIGLGGLTHPFALVYALQAGAWMLIDSRGWQRLFRPLLLAATAIGVMGLWLPQILSYPEIFVRQFDNQFLSGQEPLLNRLEKPWVYLLYHGGLLWRQIKPWQFVMALIALCGGTMQAVRTRCPAMVTLTVLSWTSIGLMAVCAGSTHSVPGYWTYPASLVSIIAGTLVHRSLGQLAAWQPIGRVLAPVCGLAIVLSMIPQSRLGTSIVHVRHWNDPAYNAPRIARQILAELPPEATVVVDAEFAMDFVAAERPGRVLAATTIPRYFLPLEGPFDYFVGSRLAMDTGILNAVPGRLVRTWGDLDNRYACYAMLYARDAAAAERLGEPGAVLPTGVVEPQPTSTDHPRSR